MREGSETTSHVEELEEEKEPRLAAAEEPIESTKKDASVGTESDSDSDSESEADAYDEAQTTAYCTVM